MAHVQKLTYTSKRTGKTTHSWQARYTAPDGHERTKRFDRKVDAENWVTTNGADVARGEWTDPSQARVRFRDWAENWKETTIDLRPSTRERDYGHLRRYITPTFGSLTLGQIDHMTVQAWASQLTTVGPVPWWDLTKEPKRKPKPLSPSTAGKAVQILSKIMALAVTAGKIRANPCIGIKLPRIERKEMRFINPTEIDTLANAITPRYKALILVGAFGGLRIGELAGLR